MSSEVVQRFLECRTEVLEFLQSLVADWPLPPLDKHFNRLLAHSSEDPRRELFLACVFELTDADVSSEEAKRYCALAWAIEILRVAFVILSDLVTDAKVRRGRPCWNLQGAGFSSVSDAYYLENSIYLVIDKYFPDRDSRRPVKALIHQATMHRCLSQMLPSGKSDVDPLSLWLPVVAGLCISQKVEQELWQSTDLRDLLFDASLLLKCKEEYADFLTDGAEIVNGSNGWMFLRAMAVADEDQRKLLHTNIGKADEDATERVKRLYRALGVDPECPEYQRVTFQALATRLGGFSQLIPPRLMERILALLRPSDV
jgi:farnesyl diphosphate synthase